MCGIAGIVDPERSALDVRLTLQRMADVMLHRGPDGEGYFADDGAGIAMRRLSIIDVAGGQQPIATEDGRALVVFNGEIYNYLELRAELIACGHTFNTRSDTEVIAHLYEEVGTGCLDRLRGMFGLAIWDRDRRRLFLARDRLGKKPLYYAVRGDRLLFGSEIKTVLAADPSLAEPDPDAVAPYLRYGFVPEPATMYQHIKKLPAGHWLTFEDGRLTLSAYWTLSFDDDGERRDIRRCAEELDGLLRESVRLRLMSEVPLGIFLSGGLDSSTVVAYAHQAGARPLKTFTIGFDREEWDESADAQVVADHFGTEHHVLTLRERDLARDLPDTVRTLVRHFDEPFGDPSALPTYHVSKLAREHVTVILGGDGGDELFAGYSSYRGIRFAELYGRVPTWLGTGVLPHAVRAGAGLLPPGRRYGALRAAKVLRDSRLPFEEMYFSKAARTSVDLLGRLLRPEVAGSERFAEPGCSQDIRDVIASDLPALSKASYVDMRFGLLDGMLVKVDRMSMANSLEVRSPFLDHVLVEYVAKLPPSFKLRGWETKAILRDVVRPYLPPPIMRKKKQGFAVPLREWFRSELREMVGDYLGGSIGTLPADIFNRAEVDATLRRHYHGEADHSDVLWLLINYAAWHDDYVRRRPDAAIRPRTGTTVLSRGGA
ncbi:MAG: asparagine synthase (glutamine-hydrolyzing) [Chloroflexota bacterium]|nr:asparagine synthase (glutamine-hydrolyzing) [Chloroflexota bacterium]